MEILPKTDFKDWLHYGVAFALSALGGVVAFLAVRQTRALLFILAGLAKYGASQQRLLNQLSWIILGLVWAVYMLSVLPLYNGAITKARVRRAQGRLEREATNARPWMRWLIEQDSDILAKRFVYTFLIPVAVWILVSVIARIAVGM
ncbi:MAG: hypothetical protein JXA21_18495 [Anaerolineae bacterium]|nr:hypothetical protein [Anaerolineae bacterium]